MFYYIKYGELVLKGKNKKNFINSLIINITTALAKFKVKIIKAHDNCKILGINEKNKEKVFDMLKLIPGINLIIPAYEVKTDFKVISEEIIKMLSEKQINTTTFKVETRRKWKEFKYDSMKMNCEMGGVILDNFKNYKVDVRKPQLLINIEIDKEKTIFYFEKHLGEGGFPIGINGRVLMLISGGIDSPVAAKLLMKKGLHVDFITFLTPPHTSNKVLEKVKKLIKIASHDSLLQRSKLFVCNFTPLQHELSHISDKSYQITLMRRYFYRIACDVAKKNKYSAIGTGESIGQVASQTLESMKVIQNSINDFLVLRPLLTYDKQEIINLSNKYKTYETSILPYEDCCTLFVPSNPQTRPKLDSAIKLESKLDMIEEIYKMVVEKIEIL